MKSSNPLIAWLAFMAGLSSLTGASVMADVVGRTGSALLFAITGALQAGTAVWVSATKPVESMPSPPARGG